MQRRQRGLDDAEAGQHPEHEETVIVRIGPDQRPLTREAAEQLRDDLNDVLQ